MRVVALHLIAYGSFTDRRLEFPERLGAADFHVVFGRNEAGKSTALQGLRDLLYGIPERTTLDFVHARSDLRVGGRLSAGDGRELEVVRRRGRLRTLLSADDGSPLAEELLSPLLGGVPADVFSTMFGIDHAALVRGGRELLAQGGELGKALFAAALGGGALREALALLQRRCEELFVPGGKRLIGETLKRLADQKAALRDASLSAHEWVTLDRRRRAVESEIAGLDAGRAERTAEHVRTERLRAALPLLADRARVIERLAALADVRLLPEDFGAQRRDALQRLAVARRDRERALADIERVRRDLAELSPSEQILAAAAAIEDLHQRLSAYTRALAELPRMRGELDTLRADADRLLRSLRPDLPAERADETLRPLLAARAPRLRALVTAAGAIGEKEERAGRSLRKAETALAAVRAELEPLPAPVPIADLEAALEAAVKRGDLDAQRAELAVEMHADEAACSGEVMRLGRWPGSWAELVAAPLPMRATLDRHAQLLDELDTQLRRAAEKRERLAEELDEVERDLLTLEVSGAVPSEADLMAARRRRDAAWTLVRGSWREGLDAAAVATAAAANDPDRELADSLSFWMGRSDEIADRLRRETDRVRRRAELAVRRDGLRTAATASAEQHTALGDRRGAQEGAWREEWRRCGVEPASPREMAVWLDRVENLRRRAEGIDRARARLGRMASDIAEHRTALAKELAAMGGTPPPGEDAERLSPWLAAGRKALALVRERAERRRGLAQRAEQLVADGDEARVALADALAEKERWSRDWSAAVVPLGLGPDAHPAEAEDAVARLGAFFARRDEAARLGAACAAAEREAAAFERDAMEIVVRTAPELATGPVQVAAAALYERFGREKDAATRRRALQDELRRHEKSLAQSAAAHADAERRLADLGRIAGCDDVAELEEKDARSNEVRALRRERERLESQLATATGEADLEATAARALGTDEAVLAARSQGLTTELESLDAQRDALHREHGELRGRLATMAGQATAAAIAEDCQETLAVLEEQVTAYFRARAALLLLRREIERVRKSSQTPLVRRAGELFRQLTLGSIGGLGIGYDAKEEPILVGLRAGDRSVTVEQMSDGTRDQLFLSLRLATLEQLATTGKTLPLIVDDILVNFDDERTAAALGVLADIACHTQVILFTHHGRIPELGGRLEAARAPVVQSLA
ncbi:MAG: AAA family ATPase [Candidatus Schekmanbacteria bacterium]|nr:AAA family ATPase [Candidatus Schekmanbacteria bacterium]